MQVAVVGAGIHGSSTAKSLAERGHCVTLYDRFEFGHSRGSSHGESRIVRKAYPDAYYTSLMAQAYPLWHRLEMQAGEQLLNEVGLLYFGCADSPQLESMVEGLISVDVPYRTLDATAVREVSPKLRLDADEVGIFTPEAGWVDAARCVRLTQRLAAANGVTFRARTVADRENLESGFDAFVVTPGAWIRDWAPRLDVEVTLQTVAFFRGELPGAVWIEDSDDLAYGFPTYNAEVGVKAAFHSYGNEVDANEAQREPDPLRIEALKEILCRRFGFHDAKVSKAYGCLYTNSPTEDFCFGRIGEKGFYASACSGHGFKFGPWIGERLADFVVGRDSPENWPRFATQTEG